MRCFASPRPAAPHRAAPELPSKESSRGSRGLLCCRLQLLPQQTGPCRAEPVPTETCLIYSPKRAAGKACALRAAVCSYYRALPYLAPPHVAQTGLTKSTLQREQQRGLTSSVLPSATVAVTDPTGPQLAVPNSGGPNPAGAYTKGCPA